MRSTLVTRWLFLCLCCAAAAHAQVLEGRVVDAASGAAVAGASVSTESTSAVTGAHGRFSIELTPGSWVVTIAASGYLDQTVSVETRPGIDPAPLEVALFEIGQFSEAVEVRASRPRRIEPTAAEIEPQEVLRVAGSLDNVFRTVQTLPGVAATEDFGSRLSVRGGEPDQNLTIMDGVEVSNPYRLFGLTSAFNPETVEHFELTAGGFSAKYGDRLSSILIVENRSGTTERRFAGSTATSITDANIIIEGGLGAAQRGSWLVTARRTYYDLVAERIVDENLPSFSDVQAKLDVGVGANGTLSFFGLRSREDTNLDIEDEDEPGEFGSVVNDAGNDLVSLSLDASIGPRANTRTIVSWYRNQDFLDFDGRVRTDTKRSNAPGDEAQGFSRVIFDRFLSVEDLALRQEFSFLAGDDHFIETGLEFHRLDTALRFETLGDRNVSEANGSSIRGGVGLPDFVESEVPANRVGVWLQDQFAVNPSWTLEPGLRLDWSEANGRGTVSPRVAAFYRLDPSTRVKGAFGVYTQSPGYEKLIQSDFFIDLSGVSELELAHQRSTHYIVGVERDFGAGLTARVEGFYKSYDDLIVGRLETEDERLERVSRYDFPAELQDSIPTAPIITSNPTNDASGSAYGFDVFLSKAATSRESRLAGWLSYTWSRAERAAYSRLYPFDYDRRHSLNVVGSYRLSRKWTLALTGRLASGFPYTPALGVRVAATEDANDPERLIPETDADGRLVYEADLGDTGNLNTGELPLYARFDVRASFRPGGDTGNFELYVEVINALNRANAIRLEPRLEYDPASDVPAIDETPTEGFPLLPSFGIRWRF